MLVRCLLACLIALLIGAEAAGATQRFTEPGGDGPPPCSQADPCGLDAAVEDVAEDGDEIVMAPGTYNIGADPIVVTSAITIRASNPANQPTVSGTGTFVVQVLSMPAPIDAPRNATIRNIRLQHVLPDAGAESAIWVLDDGTLVERVAVQAAGGGTACNMTRGTMRDSTCWSDGGFGAIGSNLSSPSGNYSSAFVNVTALNTGGSGMLMHSAGSNVHLAVSVRNTIIRGNVLIAAEDPTSSSTATLSSSNFPSSGVFGGAGTESVTDEGTGNNQTAAPDLVHGPGFEGDFHQEAGSVTIDAGTSDAALGALDFELQPRIMGDAVDIGADEFFEEDPEPPPPDDTTAPQTTITDQPKAKVRLKKGKKKAPYSFSFTANEVATFRCSLDGKPLVTCTSPFGGKVKKGLHTFSVFAVDTAGNADPTPATAEWKVKKRKRRR